MRPVHSGADMTYSLAVADSLYLLVIYAPGGMMPTGMTDIGVSPLAL